MGINRIKLQDGSPLEMAKAQEAAASDPKLDAIRQQLFGEDYVQAIGEGRGIAQYYTGFGLPQSLQFTPAPVEEAEPVVTEPVVDITEPVVDTGEGGGGIGAGDITTPDTGLTGFEQNLLDQGVGVQGAIGDPVVAPGEMPVTQEEIDAFNQTPVIQPIDIGFGEGQVDPGLAAGLERQQDLEQSGLVDLDSIGQSIADFAGTAYDKFNQSVTLPIIGKVNLASAAAKSIINKLAGGPISLVVDALSSLGLEPGRSEMSDALGEQYGMDDIGRLTGGPMEGYSVDSGFGDIRQATIDRINIRKQNNLDTEELENFLEQIERNQTAIDYNVEGTDEGDRAEQEAEDQRAQEEAAAKDEAAAKEEAAAAKAQRDFQAAVAAAQRQVDQKSGRSEPSGGVSPGFGNSRR